MGQRLVVTVYDNGERICNIYYHWSSYFNSTICELKFLKDAIVQAQQKGSSDILYELIRYLERQRGGLCINPKSREMAKKMWPDQTFTMDVNRSDGLLQINSEDMDDVYEMNEGTAWIDISTKEISNDVDLEMDFEKDQYPVDPFDLDFDKVDILYEFIQNSQQKQLGM